MDSRIDKDIEELSIKFFSISSVHVEWDCNVAAHAIAAKILHDNSFLCNPVGQLNFIIGSLPS